MNDQEIQAQIAALPSDLDLLNPPLEYTEPVPDHWHGPMRAKFKFIEGRFYTDPRLCLCPSTCSMRKR